MIFIKYCKICKEAFDIGINYEICPKCREEIKKEEDDERGNNKRYTKSRG